MTRVYDELYLAEGVTRQQIEYAIIKHQMHENTFYKFLTSEAAQ